MAHVTLELSEYDELRGRAERAEAQARDLERKLAAEPLRDAPAAVQDAVATARAALPVVRFAIANLLPENVRGWPTAALRELAERLPKLADATQDDVEFAMDMRMRADEIDKFERDVREPMDKLRALGVPEPEVQKFARGRAGDMALAYTKTIEETVQQASQNIVSTAPPEAHIVGPEGSHNAIVEAEVVGPPGAKRTVTT